MLKRMPCAKCEVISGTAEGKGQGGVCVSVCVFVIVVQCCTSKFVLLLSLCLVLKISCAEPKELCLHQTKPLWERAACTGRL